MVLIINNISQFFCEKVKSDYTSPPIMKTCLEANKERDRCSFQLPLLFAYQCFLLACFKESERLSFILNTIAI